MENKHNPKGNGKGKPLSNDTREKAYFETKIPSKPLSEASDLELIYMINKYEESTKTDNIIFTEACKEQLDKRIKIAYGC